MNGRCGGRDALFSDREMLCDDENNAALDCQVIPPEQSRRLRTWGRPRLKDEDVGMPA